MCATPRPLASGTLCTGGVCNGSGTCVECVGPTDCTDDGNQCTTAPSCTAGACDAQTPLAQGTVCDLVLTGDGLCNGSGSCVECNFPTDCPDDGNQCTTAPSCTANACDAQTPLANGTLCDNGGGPGSGACDGAGTCI